MNQLRIEAIEETQNIPKDIQIVLVAYSKNQ